MPGNAFVPDTVRRSPRARIVLQSVRTVKLAIAAKGHALACEQHHTPRRAMTIRVKVQPETAEHVLQPSHRKQMSLEMIEEPA